ncbi:MAG: sigma factor, partial [Aureliella sp.]
MAKFPQTRISLILRLAQADDVLAWHEFAELYTPVLFQLAKRKGLQNADAEDVTQDILCAVARAAQRFEQNA